MMETCILDFVIGSRTGESTASLHQLLFSFPGVKSPALKRVTLFLEARVVLQLKERVANNLSDI